MLHKRSHHFWAGRNLRWRRQLRLEVVRTQALVGKGVGGTLRPLHQQAGGGGGRRRRRWGRGRGREGAGLWVLDESSLDRSVVLLLGLLLHHHVEVGAGCGALDLAPGLLSLLWSVFIVRVLNLVEKSQLLGLGSVGRPLLLGQNLPFLSQVLKRREDLLDLTAGVWWWLAGQRITRISTIIIEVRNGVNYSGVGGEAFCFNSNLNLLIFQSKSL